MSRVFAFLLSFTLISISLLSMGASTSTEKFIAGKDYEVLPQPVVTRNKNKVEVVELFWYGCGHCYTFESLFSTWKKNQGADVDIVQMPAIWNKSMDLHAKAYFTAQALGVLDKIHEPLFDALIMKREKLYSEKSIQEFFSKYGVDKKTFEDTFNSFGVNSQTALAKSRLRSYKVRGTPEVIINGKYRISVSQVKTQEKVLEVASFLIEKERKSLPSTSTKNAS